MMGAQLGHFTHCYWSINPDYVTEGLEYCNKVFDRILQKLLLPTKQTQAKMNIPISYKRL